MDLWEKCVCHSCESNQLVQLQAGGYQASAINNVAVSKNVSPPPWFNPEEFKRGQEFFRVNFLSLLVSNLVGLYTILHVNNIVSVLVDTGRSSTVATAKLRYLSTMRHLYAWYTSDPFRHGDKANKSIRLVRQLHRSAILISKNGHQDTKSSHEQVDCCNKELQPLTADVGQEFSHGYETLKDSDTSLKSGSDGIEDHCKNAKHSRKRSEQSVCMNDYQKQISSSSCLIGQQCSPLPHHISKHEELMEKTSSTISLENHIVSDAPSLGCMALSSRQRASQVDMVATQWAFCGLVALKAKELGITESSMHLLPGFFHFWRTIGYLMGIEDRFNLCHPADDGTDCSSITDRMTALLHQFLRPAVARADRTSRAMAEAMMLGSQKIVPVVSADVFTCYSHWLLDVPERPELQGMYLQSLLAFQIYFLGDLIHWPIFGPLLRWFVNFLMLFAMTFADSAPIVSCVEALVGLAGIITALLRALGLGCLWKALVSVVGWLVAACTACYSIWRRQGEV